MQASDWTAAAAQYGTALGHARRMQQQAGAVQVALQVPLHLNLAMCAIKMEDWHAAVAQCTGALALEPRSAKALYRRATALANLQRYAVQCHIMPCYSAVVCAVR
jgi:tetratricopeptide (TPR) repeat protein